MRKNLGESFKLLFESFGSLKQIALQAFFGIGLLSPGKNAHILVLQITFDNSTENGPADS